MWENTQNGQMHLKEANLICKGAHLTILQDTYEVFLLWFHC